MLKENTAALRELLTQAENLPEAVSDPLLQEKSATPTKSVQDIVPDVGYDGLSKVSVEAIPEEYVVPVGETQITSNGKHTVSGFATASVEVPIPTFTTQEKTVTPTKEVQNVTPDSGKDGLSKVVVNAIPAEYIIPSGETTVNTNGSHDVTQFESVKVEVPIPTFTTQEKSVNPTESQQEVVPDTGKDGLSKVTVGAVSSTYVGSGIARKSSTDLTATGATVSVPAGYYASAASKAVSTATQATPTIEVSTAGLITAKATQTAGYVTAGEKSATKQLTVQAGTTITPTKSEQTAVASGRYTTGDVKVAAIPSEYITTSDANATANDIVKDKTAYVNGAKINGGLVVQKYYTGSSAPAASLGSDGDLYLEVRS